MDGIEHLYRYAATNVLLPEYYNVGADRIKELREQGVPTTTHELWAEEERKRIFLEGANTETTKDERTDQNA